MKKGLILSYIGVLGIRNIGQTHLLLHHRITADPTPTPNNSVGFILMYDDFFSRYKIICSQQIISPVSRRMFGEKIDFKSRTLDPLKIFRHRISSSDVKDYILSVRAPRFLLGT